MAAGSLELAAEAPTRRESEWTAICPRCGYDVGGIIETWVELCPTHGICSECGLDFEWVDVLLPNRNTPAWFVERGPLPPKTSTARSMTNWIARWWGTMIRLAKPARFWRQIELKTPVKARSLALVGLSSLVMLHLAASSWRALGVFGPVWLMPRPLSNWAKARAVIWPFSDATTAWFWLAVIAAVVAPWVFLCLGSTLEAAKVRRAQVARVGVYGVAGVCAIMLLVRLLLGAVQVTEWVVSPKPAARPPAVGTGGFGIVPPRGLMAGAMPRFTPPAVPPPSRVWEASRTIALKSSWSMLLSLAWLGVFWRMAIGRYLRLPHAGGVTAAVMIIAILGAVAVLQEAPGSQFEWYRHTLREIFSW